MNNVTTYSEEDVGTRSGDLVLAQGEYALVQDGTNGSVQVVVGPHKISIAGTDNPVDYDIITRRFVKTQKLKAIKQCVNAREGQYIVLTNPSSLLDGAAVPYPTKGVHSAIPLNNGRKVNIPGPATFALYPGQYAEVIDGHQLRSNQYLVVRVYNEEEAKKNWGSAVVKKATGDTKEDAKTMLKQVAGDASNLTIGKLLNIKGVDVSFYIPPTGIEVVPDEEKKMVRDALTLQRLTYCILLSEDGEKRYVKGPAVVFPEPTETIVTQDKSPKYKAIELNDAMGLYIKVIADYEEAGVKYVAGDELFITGAVMKIYFPRPEHALIRYGQDLIHYAVAIPKGEARYMLQKDTGEVKLVQGPKMFLPDPRKEVIVRRVLDSKICDLWFPGNEEAQKQNIKFMQEYELNSDSDLNERVLATTLEKSARDLYGSSLMNQERKASDHVTRNRNFTPPRTITLNTKYDGAVAINIWTGYAVQIVNKAGQRRIIQGPNTILLEYDESLEVMKLSRGCPKSSDNQLRTVYLRVANNKISDYVVAETKDLVNVALKLSYTVNFEDDSNKWYNIEDYVKYLTDHLRSIIRNTIKKQGIEEFAANAIDILRNAILGLNTPEKGRLGKVFTENGMRICDVDVLEVQIGDAAIGSLLKLAQHSAVKETLQVQAEQRRLVVSKISEKIKQEILDLTNETTRKMYQIQAEKDKIEAEIITNKLQEDESNQEILDGIARAKLARKTANDNQKLEALKGELVAEADNYQKKFAAITPGLVEAIVGLGDKQLATELAKNLPAAEGSLGILLGINGLDQLRSMVSNTAIERGLDTAKIKKLSQGRAKTDDE